MVPRVFGYPPPVSAPDRRVIADAGPTAAQPPFRFSMRQRVHLHDTDAIGVVYFGNWARFVEQSVVAYRQHLGLDPIGTPGHWYLIRAYAIDFHASARLGDEIETFVRCATIGRTSQTFEARIERTGDHLADARLVVVGVDAHGAGATPTPVPDETRRVITGFDRAA